MNASAVVGQCLCGAVQYRVDGPLHAADHCHCSMCRRQHGAAFATYADCAPADFAWTAGGSHVRVFTADGGGGWAFCERCGSTLAGTADGRVTSVTLGTVHGDPGVRPESHIFVDSKATWYTIEDGLIQHATRSDGVDTRDN